MTARTLYAEFDDPRRLVAAVAALRARGCRGVDSHTPYAVPGLDDALGGRPSRIGWAALAGGLVGAAGAYLVAWLAGRGAAGVSIGGRPDHAPLAFLVLAFEGGVLVAALAAVAAMLIATGLPRLWHPAFEIEGFERATVDRFWLSVEAEEPAGPELRPALALELEPELEPELVRLGALRVVAVGPGGAA